MGLKTGQSRETHPIRDGIVQALRGVGGIFTETSEAVSRAISEAIFDAEHAGGALADPICEIVRSAVNALGESREDTAAAIKGITVGVFRGIREFGPAARSTLAQVSRFVIQETIEQGGDLDQAFRGLVRGAVHSARDLEMSASSAAAAAAESALATAEDYSSDAGDQIRSAAAAGVDGIRILFGERARSPVQP